MTNRTKGIICILISSLGFSVMNLFIPLAGDINTIEKSFFRNLVALFVSLVILYRQKDTVKASLREKSLPWKVLMWRAVLGTLGVYANYYSLDQLVISDATVLSKLAPFATLILSAIFLKEKMSKEHVFALIVAFIGVIFVSKPSGEMASFFPYFIAILGGVFAGAAYTCVRYLNRLQVHGAIIVAFFSFFSCVVSIPYLLFHFDPLTFKSLAYLMGAGVAATFGQFGITWAYKYAPASEISIFDYSALIFSGVLGYLFLNQIPDKWSIMGYFIIFAGALLTFLYNRDRARKLS